MGTRKTVYVSHKNYFTRVDEEPTNWNHESIIWTSTPEYIIVKKGETPNQANAVAVSATFQLSCDPWSFTLTLQSQPVL